MEKSEIDYGNYLFNFLRIKHIPYSVMAFLFVFLTFLLPKICIFEFVLNISWTNIFYLSNEYLIKYSC